jgi:Tol biopolymer transport system component
VSSAAWSPDGTQLAFTSRGSVSVVNADGTRVHGVYAGSGTSLHPSWSFDSRTVAFESKSGSFWHVWLVGADGSAPHALDTGRWNDRLPVWAPFTPHLAFVSDRQRVGRRAALYVDFVVSGRTRKEVDGVDPASPPAWSPDARRLAYSARRGCARWAIFVKLYGARTDRRLTNSCR